MADMKPTALIIRTAGTNCDRELAHAFTLAGATVRTEHLNHLIAEPAIVDQADIIGFPGGFSYGDDIAAGRIFANRLRHGLLEPLQRAVQRGVPMIGICNGFQVLAKLGLLPNTDGRQTVTLAENTSGRFIDRWVRLTVPQNTQCIWTRDLGECHLPIAHGEGRFVTDNDQTLASIKEQNQIAIVYASDDNPNGSVDDIAGICDPSGLVFGLMPHPERFVHPTNDPSWTRRGTEFLKTEPAGLIMIRNAVTFAASTVAV